ncbi:unnamed protein product [Chrysoparadoxa australica]
MTLRKAALLAVTAALLGVPSLGDNSERDQRQGNLRARRGQATIEVAPSGPADDRVGERDLNPSGRKLRGSGKAKDGHATHGQGHTNHGHAHAHAHGRGHSSQQHPSGEKGHQSAHSGTQRPKPKRPKDWENIVIQHEGGPRRERVTPPKGAIRSWRDRDSSTKHDKEQAVEVAKKGSGVSSSSKGHSANLRPVPAKSVQNVVLTAGAEEMGMKAYLEKLKAQREQSREKEARERQYIDRQNQSQGEQREVYNEQKAEEERMRQFHAQREERNGGGQQQHQQQHDRGSNNNNGGANTYSRGHGGGNEHHGRGNDNDRGHHSGGHSDNNNNGGGNTYSRGHGGGNEHRGHHSVWHGDNNNNNNNNRGGGYHHSGNEHHSGGGYTNNVHHGSRHDSYGSHRGRDVHNSGSNHYYGSPTPRRGMGFLSRLRSRREEWKERREDRSGQRLSRLQRGRRQRQKLRGARRRGPLRPNYSNQGQSSYHGEHSYHGTSTHGQGHGSQHNQYGSSGHGHHSHEHHHGPWHDRHLEEEEGDAQGQGDTEGDTRKLDEVDYYHIPPLEDCKEDPDTVFFAVSNSDTEEGCNYPAGMPLMGEAFYVHEPTMVDGREGAKPWYITPHKSNIFQVNPTHGRGSMSLMLAHSPYDEPCMELSMTARGLHMYGDPHVDGNIMFKDEECWNKDKVKNMWEYFDVWIGEMSPVRGSACDEYYGQSKFRMKRDGKSMQFGPEGASLKGSSKIPGLAAWGEFTMDDQHYMAVGKQGSSCDLNVQLTPTASQCDDREYTPKPEPKKEEQDDDASYMRGGEKKPPQEMKMSYRDEDSSDARYMRGGKEKQRQEKKMNYQDEDSSDARYMRGRKERPPQEMKMSYRDNKNYRDSKNARYMRGGKEKPRQEMKMRYPDEDSSHAEVSAMLQKWQAKKGRKSSNGKNLRGSSSSESGSSSDSSSKSKSKSNSKSGSSERYSPQRSRYQQATKPRLRSAKAKKEKMPSYYKDKVAPYGGGTRGYNGSSSSAGDEGKRMDSYDDSMDSYDDSMDSYEDSMEWHDDSKGYYGDSMGHQRQSYYGGMDWDQVRHAPNQVFPVTLSSHTIALSLQSPSSCQT